MSIRKINLFLWILFLFNSCGKKANYTKFLNYTVWQDSIPISSFNPIDRDTFIVKLNSTPDSSEDYYFPQGIFMHLNDSFLNGLVYALICPYDLDSIRNYQYLTSPNDFEPKKKSCYKLIQYNENRIGVFCWFPLLEISKEKYKYFLKGICIDSKDSISISVYCGILDTCNIENKFKLFHDIFTDYELIVYSKEKK